MPYGRPNKLTELRAPGYDHDVSTLLLTPRVSKCQIRFALLQRDAIIFAQAGHTMSDHDLRTGLRSFLRGLHRLKQKLTRTQKWTATSMALRQWNRDSKLLPDSPETEITARRISMILAIGLNGLSLRKLHLVNPRTS